MSVIVDREPVSTLGNARAREALSEDGVVNKGASCWCSPVAVCAFGLFLKA